MGGTIAFADCDFLICLFAANAPEAQQAPQLASVGPRRAPGPPDLGGEAPPEEHQLIELPGPIASPILMVFFAGLYVITCYWRRNRI